MPDLSTSRSVERTTTGSTQVKVVPTVDEVYGLSLPTGTVEDYIDTLKSHALHAAQAQGLNRPTGSALNNVMGAWFEILVAVTAWNYCARTGLTNLVIMALPNVSRFNFRDIFDPETQEILEDLERSLRVPGQEVQLITSNPDMLLIRQEGVYSHQIMPNLSAANVMTVLGAYQNLQGSILWNSLKAGLGLKTSLRPDRRLQLVHEGNILKALYAHLKMRHWQRDAHLKYYGITLSPLSEANTNALYTAATHSIVNVDSNPERAVDVLYTTPSVAEIEGVIASIVARH